MSIYKGGYILADISDTPLNVQAQDLLSQDLKDYISKYFDDNTGVNKEILYKPIKLLVNINNFKCLVEFTSISDDDTELDGYTMTYNGMCRVGIVIDGGILSILYSNL